VVAKCEDYHAWGVKYGWIIDPEDNQCWEYESGSRPREIPPDGEITAQEIRISAKDLFAV
jgi:Uma2 family endonuclease